MSFEPLSDKSVAEIANHEVEMLEDGRCGRVEYSLTDTGKSLMPAIMALIAWGKEHFNEVVTD